MENSLINELRSVISDNDVLYQYYKNNREKNHWNIICSAVDWMEVVIDEIDIDQIKKHLIIRIVLN